MSTNAHRPNVTRTSIPVYKRSLVKWKLFFAHVIKKTKKNEARKNFFVTTEQHGRQNAKFFSPVHTFTRAPTRTSAIEFRFLSIPRCIFPIRCVMAFEGVCRRLSSPLTSSDDSHTLHPCGGVPGRELVWRSLRTTPQDLRSPLSIITSAKKRKGGKGTETDGNGRKGRRTALPRAFGVGL